MDLAEMFHRPLGETLATVDNGELYLWIARAQRKAKREGPRVLPMKGRR
jgi:hypothetical protein